jgi:hypothetical protein
MRDGTAIIIAMAGALALFLAAIGAVYVLGQDDPSYCDFYPKTCEYNKRVGR